MSWDSSEIRVSRHFSPVYFNHPLGNRQAGPSRPSSVDAVKGIKFFGISFS
jgi:hypothetical protein